jgi:hypothetical protein
MRDGLDGEKRIWTAQKYKEPFRSPSSKETIFS